MSSDHGPANSLPVSAGIPLTPPYTHAQVTRAQTGESEQSRQNRHLAAT